MQTVTLGISGMTCGGCVRSAIRSGEGEAAIDELMAVVKRFGR